MIMFEALDSACVNFGVTWYQVVKQGVNSVTESIKATQRILATLL